jgi:acetolactate synthase I/II/III large subunit
MGGNNVKASVFLARYLRSQGLERAFGLPGGEAVAILEGLRQVGVPFVLTHHESPAGYMAGATGLLTGVPGLCISTRGPGAVNMVSPVAMAYLDRLPLIAVSGDLEPSQVGHFTHQWLDLTSLFAPITKYSGRVTAANIATEIPKAVEIARSGRPGPVYLAFPGSESVKDVPDMEDLSIEEIGARFTPERPVPSDPDLSSVVEALRTAKKPILMAGLGVSYAKSGAELRALAEQLRAPVTVTAQSKGHFPEDHPLFAGTFGVYTDAPVYELIGEADLIVAVGLDGVEFFKPWKIQTPVVSIAPSDADDFSYKPKVAINGDLATMLDTLRKEVEPKEGWALQRIAECRRGVDALMTPDVDEYQGRVAPQAIVRELRQVLPRNGIITVDVGAHKLVLTAQWPAYDPETYLTTNGLSSMGFAIPGAIAAKLAKPDAPVVATIGDGGFLMFTGELGTIARLNLAVVVVVLNDGGLSSIKVKQAQRKVPTIGVDFGQVDYAGIARDFGLLGFKATTMEEFRKALSEALDSGRGAVVEVMTHYDEYLKYQ